MIKIEDIVKLGPVIPVLAFDSAEQGEDVSRALHAGGVKSLRLHCVPLLVLLLLSVLAN